MVKGNLVRFVIEVGLLALLFGISTGCSNMRAYIGTYPLGSDLTVKQKKEIMRGRERQTRIEENLWYEWNRDRPEHQRSDYGVELFNLNF